MDGGEIAALIAAGAFAMLVIVLAVPILRLRRTVDAATRALVDLNSRTGPLVAEATGTVHEVTRTLGQVQTSLDGVNLQLAKVDTITGHAESITGNVANLASVVTAAAANPLVKVAAFGYGVRRASALRRKRETERDVRAALKAERRVGR